MVGLTVSILFASLSLGPVALPGQKKPEPPSYFKYLSAHEEEEAPKPVDVRSEGDLRRAIGRIGSAFEAGDASEVEDCLVRSRIFLSLSAKGDQKGSLGLARSSSCSRSSSRNERPAISPMTLRRWSSQGTEAFRSERLGPTWYSTKTSSSPRYCDSRWSAAETIGGSPRYEAPFVSVSSLTSSRTGHLTCHGSSATPGQHA